MCHYLIGTGLFECESLALAGVPQGGEGVVDVLCSEEFILRTNFCQGVYPAEENVSAQGVAQDLLRV